VTACTVTPDGRRVVSASWDGTLKVWDVESGACLFTQYANAAYTAFIATATAIVAGDASGAIWFLDVPLLREYPSSGFPLDTSSSRPST